MRFEREPSEIQTTVYVKEIPVIGKELIAQNGQSLGEIIEEPQAVSPKQAPDPNAFTYYRVRTTQGYFKDVQVAEPEGTPSLSSMEDPAADIKKMTQRLEKTDSPPAPKLSEMEDPFGKK